MIVVYTNDPTWIQSFSESIIAPIIVAAIAYFLFGKIDELRKRKSYSRLGASIIHTLIEEVEGGRNSIRNTLDPNNRLIPNPLPRKSWSGINTVPDEVLLRILELTKKSAVVGFPANEIRIHTKNYFDHMVTNWDQVIQQVAQGQNFKAFAQQFYQSYDEAATGVLEMLKHIKVLLDNNSKKCWPK